MNTLVYRAYDIGDGRFLGPYPFNCFLCGKRLMLDAECGSEECCGYQYRLEIVRIDLVVEKEVS